MSSFRSLVLRRRGAVVWLKTGCLVWALAACSPSQTPAPSAEVEVGVVTLHSANVALEVELAGRAKARTVAEIRPQVSGIIRKRAFVEGAQVRAGQLLYELDDASYKAAFDSAQASVAKAEATLRSAEVTAKRQQALAKIEAVSQQTADDAQASYEEARAALGVARAERETARVNLDYTRITSPISGRVDLSAYSQGALVTANQDTALTTVRQTDPLVVDVNQSSADLLALRRAIEAGTVQRQPQDTLAVRIVLEDGSSYPQPAQLQYHGISVDEGTGMVTLRAEVPNPDGVLMPGMYLRARVDQGILPDAILAPQQAVSRNASGGASAWVLAADGSVAQRQLTLGDAVGNQWRVLKGLSAGERVVVQGLQKLQAGQKVRAIEVDLKTGAAAEGTAVSTSAGTAK